MCSQLMEHVNISFEICANVSRGLWDAAGAFRGRFGEGSGKVRGRFGECSGKVRGSHGGATARTPCGHFYWTLIILPQKPSSELAIREYFIGNMCNLVSDINPSKLQQQSTLIASVLGSLYGSLYGS